jgi:micrococcal nuclease
MQILPIATAVSLAVASMPGPAHSDPVLVRSVLDGDTIDVVGAGRVRLLGIDAPEIAHSHGTAAPFAHEAREKLVELVLHRWVRLEADVERVDGYNRHLAYVVREDGLFVNAVLLREGLARVNARMSLSRLPELRRAEAEARASRRGMWGHAPPVHAPSYTRRRKSTL